jgi:lysophospholipase L1-like esterase
MQTSKKTFLLYIAVILLTCNLIGLVYLMKGLFFNSSTAYKEATPTNTVQEEPYGYFSQIRSFQKQLRQDGEIVLLGDSQTAGNWAWKEHLGKENVINRGISSDSINGFLYRMHETLRTKPSKLFVEVGINDIRNIEFDLYAERAYVTYITNNYKKLFDTLQQRLPDTEIYVTSILPTVERSISNCFQCNNKVDTINAHLQILCKQYNFKYLNIHDQYIRSGAPHEMDAQFTFDGLHLNREGYKIWEDELKKNLD